jgi:hypothetical protein
MIKFIVIEQYLFSLFSCGYWCFLEYYYYVKLEYCSNFESLPKLKKTGNYHVHSCIAPTFLPNFIQKNMGSTRNINVNSP